MPLLLLLLLLAAGVRLGKCGARYSGWRADRPSRRRRQTAFECRRIEAALASRADAQFKHGGRGQRTFEKYLNHPVGVQELYSVGSMKAWPCEVGGLATGFCSEGCSAGGRKLFGGCPCGCSADAHGECSADAHEDAQLMLGERRTEEFPVVIPAEFHATCARRKPRIRREPIFSGGSRSRWSAVIGRRRAAPPI